MDLFFAARLHLQTKAGRGVSGPVLHGDVTGGELENTGVHSHALLYMPLVPLSTGQCCLHATLAGWYGYSFQVIHTALDPPHNHHLRQETYKQYFTMHYVRLSL